MKAMLSSPPMPNTDLQDSAGRSPTKARVWDLPTRLFHWGTVCLVALSWITAENGLMSWHLWSGTALLTLLIFRLAWGVIGSTTARFSHFVTHPQIVIGYIKSLMRGIENLSYPGHNPAGGWMVVALIVILSLQASTGLFANDGVHFNGPLAMLVGGETSDRLTELHGILFKIILTLVWCHVVAVGFYMLVKGENLVQPMFTGEKDAAKLPGGQNLRFIHPLVALAVWALVAGFVWWMVRP